MDGEQHIRRWLVSGRVQGVGFRAATRREALRLAVNGCARNLADGRVEVCAAGSPAALRALEEWLWHGPRLARVVEVAAAEPPVRVTEGFATA